MRKYLLIILSFFYFSLFAQTNYYLSNSGDDVTGDGSISTPWATLSKINAKIADATISNGDSILLRCGDTFAAYPIDLTVGVIFEQYGTGNDPVISSLDTISGLTQKNDSLYYKPGITSEPRFMIFDGKPVKKGALPYGEFSAGYTAESITGTNTANCQITDTWLNGYDFTDAEMVCHESDYNNAVYQITAHSGSTITINENAYGAPQTIDAYFIQNHPVCFQDNGNWAWINDTLWVHSEDAITNHSIVIPSGLSLFRALGTGSLVVKNISIVGINDTICRGTSTMSVEISSCNLKYFSHGVRASLTGGDVVISNNTVDYCFGRFASPTCGTFEGNYNTITNNGTILGIPNTGAAGYTGSVFYAQVSTYSETAYNRMDSSGYNMISNGVLNIPNNGNWVHDNYLTNSNIFLTDGGAIHIGTATDTVHIYNNVVENGNRGVYQDHGGRYFMVYNNVIIYCDEYGYYCNDAKDSWVYNNIFWGSRIGMKFTQWTDSTELGYIDNLNVYNNTIYGNTYKSMEYAFGTVTLPNKEWPNVDFGALDNNIYIGDDGFRLGNTALGVSNYTFSEYQGLSYEPNSTLLTGVTPSLRYATDTPVTLSNDSTYTYADGTTSIGGTIGVNSGKVVIYVTYSPVIPSGEINSILGGYYGGYLNGGYYGGSIIGTKQ